LSFGERLSYSFQLLLSPSELFEELIEFNEVGTWTIGKTGEPINGIMLLIVWIAEFILIAGFAIFLTFSFQSPLSKSRFPFSETANDWYINMNKTMDIDAPEDLLDNLKSRMEGGNFAELVLLAKGSKEKEELSKSFRIRLNLYKPPQNSFDEPYYLDIDKVIFTLKNNKYQESAKTLVKYLAIDNQSVMEIWKISQI